MTGAVDNHYEIKTNDPRNKLIKLTLVARLKPLPDFVKQITNVNIESGEQAGAFNVWPTAQPVILLEGGKSAAIALRIKPVAPNTLTLKLAAGTPASVKLRRESDGYWLDVAIEPTGETGTHTFPITIESSDGSTLSVKVHISTPAENLIASPRELDLGEMSLADIKSGVGRRGRLGVRKLVGTFQIKSLTSTLDFLKLEQQTIVGGSNYLIRIGVNPAVAVKAGAYSGKVRIETDDGQIMEVPVKLTLR